MKILFVIVTYNSSEFIADCLRSIMTVRCEFHFDVLVVDNASTDGTRDIVRSFSQVELICLQENVGFGCANNRAVFGADSDYFFLINADAFLCAEFDFRRVIEFLEENPNVAVLGTRLQYPDCSPQTSSFSFSSPGKWLLQCLPFFNRFLSFMKGNLKFLRLLSMISKKAKSFCVNADRFERNYSTRDVDWVSGASMLVRSSYVERYGLFDENIFMYGEDEDLCIAAQKNGFRVVLMDSHPVTHVHGWNSSNKYSSAVSRYKFDSLKYFVEKNIDSSVSKFLMRALLPIYVYGFSRVITFYR